MLILQYLKWINSFYSILTSINLFDYLTISSLTHAIMGAFGAYDDVYQMCGNLREFCGNFVTGGRVQVNEKYKKKIIGYTQNSALRNLGDIATSIWIF